ncbi:MAG: hypothetical protein GY835_16335 [bacterium]|nr:hypothetical protein [bacterium]
MPRLSISLLGAFRVTLDGKPITDFESDKVRMLLAYLVVKSERPHRRERLADLLWPDKREPRRNLSQALARLRDAIGDRDATPPFLLITRQDIQFNPASDYEVDVNKFVALLKAYDPCDKGFEQVEELYRGKFLEGLSVRGSAELDDWLWDKQDRLHQMFECIRLRWKNCPKRSPNDSFPPLPPVPSNILRPPPVLAARIADRLDIQEPACLFGVDDKLAELTMLLTTGTSPWLVALTGIGGIGKTSLANAAVREIAHTPAFVDIAWVSARQDRFTLWNGLSEDSERGPALTFESVLDVIIEQFGFQDLATLPLDQKRSNLRAQFKARPYLVVLDNLETASDHSTLAPSLKGIINPSKFLLTSRYSLHEYFGIYNLSLDELSAQDSLTLLRHEAGERGLVDVAAASDKALSQVYQVTGGNPLALKLLLGQMHTLSLPQVVQNLCQAQGQTVEELYRFIYWRSWHLLSRDAQRVLSIMPLVAESGGELEQLSVLSELAGEQLMAALKQLVTLSLVNVRGTIKVRRYNIHRLTETFLLNEVLKWQAVPRV